MSIELRAGLPILAFPTPLAFGVWLTADGETSKGAWLRFAKKGHEPTGLTKPEAIDAALCHGWIDGQQDRYDAASWLTRFTPRKRDSRWSEINRTRALELLAAGRMRLGGLGAIEAARANGRWEAAYAPASTAVAPDDLRAALDRSPRAAAAFASLGANSRYSILYRIGSAKRAETRKRKIIELVQMLDREDVVPDR